MDWLLRLRTLPWSSEGAKSVDETEHKAVQVWRLAAVKGCFPRFQSALQGCWRGGSVYRSIVHTVGLVPWMVKCVDLTALRKYLTKATAGDFCGSQSDGTAHQGGEGMAAGAWRQLITVCPIVREQRAKDAGTLFLSPFINLRQEGTVHIQSGSSPAVKALWKYPHRSTQRCVSMVAPTKVTLKIHQHGKTAWTPMSRPLASP